MEGIGAEKKSPYHGLGIVCAILIGVPFIFFWVFYGCFTLWGNKDGVLNVYGSIAFASMVGTLFHISLIITGLWKEPLQKIGTRISSFLEYYPIVKRKAFSVYLDDIKEDGIVFWIYLFIFLAILFCAVFFFLTYLKGVNYF